MGGVIDDEFVRGRPARSSLGAPTGVDPENVLPLVDYARWSTNVEVKRDAVAGLASLAKSDANKEVMGKMGALAALIELVFKDDKNPTAYVTGHPKRTNQSSTGRFRVGTLEAKNGGGQRHSLDGQPSLEDLSALPRRNSLGSSSVVSKTAFRVKGNAGDLQLTRLSAQTLATLLTNRANQEQFVEAGGLENTYRLVEQTTSVGLRTSLATILNNLARTPEYQARIMDSDGLSAVIELANSSDDKACMNAVSCCKRLSTLNTNQHKWPVECLEKILSWLDVWDTVKLQLLTMDTITHLCEDCEVNRARLVELGGVPKIAQYLDMDKYDDDIRLLAAKCISKIAISEVSRPHLALPQVLDSFRSLVEHGMVVNDVEQLRAALDAMCMLADCEENKTKLSDAGYVEVIFHTVDTVSDKILRRSCTKCLMLIAEADDCREQMMVYIPKVIMLMQNSDYNTQFSATTLLYYLSQKKRCRTVIILQVGKIMKLLDHWMEVPDEQFNRLAIKLGANLVIDEEAKSEVMHLLPSLKHFMMMTKSKDGDTQTGAASFLCNLSNTLDDKHRSNLVEAGAVWRLKSIERSARQPMARQIASTALKTHLADHVAVIKIQAMVRGRLHRMRSRKRMDKMSAQEAATN